MSWTRRVNHPSELVAVGQEIDVVVLDINKEKLEISLGVKQTEVNPWELVAEKYPTGTIIEGKVRNLANYGAFIEIEPGIDGLLHVSDISWTKKVAHPNELY
jgi:small subunit ribosomal protein S1